MIEIKNSMTKEIAKEFILSLEKIIPKNYCIEEKESYFSGCEYYIYLKGNFWDKFFGRFIIGKISISESNIEIRLEKEYAEEIISIIEKIDNEILNIEIRVGEFPN